MNGKFTVISLFAGCGGSSLGYKLAGFNELLAIDFNNNAVETFKLNFPKVPVWLKDIRKIKGQEILDFVHIKKGELDILDGSPPCQGFSTAGKREVQDKRNDLVKEYIRFIEELQPKVFVMENVSGMIKGYIKGLFIEYIKKMKSLNYKVKVKLMNTMYYNIPQARQRLIFIGVRKDLDLEPSYPIPNRQVIIVRQAFKNIYNSKEEIEEAYKRTPNYIKPYLQLMRAGERAEKYTHTYFNHRRTFLDKPSCTLMKTPNIYHYKENRLLTISEMKRLSSFPDSFIFTGSYLNKCNRIGNAVPPLFMKAIAENIKENILKKL